MSDFSAFFNRLRKNARHWAKWARRQEVSCYRVYDRDVPEFPLAVDIYRDHAHLQEFDTGWQMPEEAHAQWVESVRQNAAEALELPLQRVIYKLRARQRGESQYEKTGTTGEDFVVEEGGHRFIVNLTAYLDTGLFLDHRITRRMVQERAAGKRFLNLFAYTGSFTVYAAAGGASGSVTVDMSNTYQDWSLRNFELNGMDLKRHRLVRADVFAYLDQAIAAGEKFDLIVMDPPSFSNSKKMQGVLDVQRDYPRLINTCLELLAPGGELFFSTNLRSFRLDESALASGQVRDISSRTIPDDFRNKKIHYCWQIHKP
ncbi:MAG: class I SAM-dependent methyltransferase [Sulfuricella denitrificans]|nr:class I SAM-dependent methyltransferase [Sulfuricella denitrificans]